MDTQADWCVRCRHMIRMAPRAWVHVSDDDWSGASCPCANELRSCLPGGSLKAEGPVQALRHILSRYGDVRHDDR